MAGLIEMLGYSQSLDPWSSRSCPVGIDLTPSWSRKWGPWPTAAPFVRLLAGCPAGQWGSPCPCPPPFPTPFKCRGRAPEISSPSLGGDRRPPLPCGQRQRTPPSEQVLPFPHPSLGPVVRLGQVQMTWQNKMEGAESKTSLVVRGTEGYVCIKDVWEK